MGPERWKRVEELYHEALGLGQSGRTAFLERTCAEDAELRREVESLLDFEAEAESFLESPLLGGAAGLGPEGPPRSLVGRSVGPYRVLSLLGAGGAGEVYRAEDGRSGRVVALKLLSAELAEDPEWVRRFEKEARSAASLRHPNIPVLYESGRIEGVPFLAAELVEGRTLRELLEAGPLGLGQALSVAVQAARALAAAHEAGIVHRDIKPENLVVGADGTVKVLDFGIAKRTGAAPGDGFASHATASTRPGTVLGTVPYMSPEQALGEKVDARTDVYSLGVVLYEMVAGRLPFEGPTPVVVISRLLYDEPPPLSRVRPGVPPELERVVGRALAREREARFSEAKQMLRELEALQAKLFR
jgi:eukaryotic-like serine/threonine-protein kinase